MHEVEESLDDANRPVGFAVSAKGESLGNPEFGELVRYEDGQREPKQNAIRQYAACA